MVKSSPTRFPLIFSSNFNLKIIKYGQELAYSIFFGFLFKIQLRNNQNWSRAHLLDFLCFFFKNLIRNQANSVWSWMGWGQVPNPLILAPSGPHQNAILYFAWEWCTFLYLFYILLGVFIFFDINVHHSQAKYKKY